MVGVFHWISKRNTPSFHARTLLRIRTIDGLVGVVYYGGGKDGVSDGKGVVDTILMIFGQKY
jgi:hypothetical protein